MSATKRGWIGVDLDGTLAEYHGWRGMDHIGKPIPAMVDRVKKMLATGADVRIFTARICPQQSEADIDIALRAITHWTFTHIGQQLPITCVKDFEMIKLFDDRCVSVIMNTGEIVPPDAVRESADLRAGLFAANIRIEELRAVLREVLPFFDGTIGYERPVVAAKVKAALENKVEEDTDHE